jgi:hypothetical protein
MVDKIIIIKDVMHMYANGNVMAGLTGGQHTH